MLMLLTCEPVAPCVRLPQIKLAPLVKVITPIRELPALLPTVTPPETVSIGLPLAANVSVAVPAVAPQIWRLAHSALLRSLVTVTPLLIVTVSPAAGTALPPHVTVELQLPETDAVRAAALADVALTNVASATKVDTRSGRRGEYFINLKVESVAGGKLAGPDGQNVDGRVAASGVSIPDVFIAFDLTEGFVRRPAKKTRPALSAALRNCEQESDSMFTSDWAKTYATRGDQQQKVLPMLNPGTIRSRSVKQRKKAP